MNWTYHGLQDCPRGSFQLCHSGGDRFRRVHAITSLGSSDTFVTDMADDWSHRLSARNWRTTGVPTEGATFEPYEDTQPPVEPEQLPAPVQDITPDGNQSPQVPVQILQVAWLLSALLNENPEANAGLIQQIQQSPVGQLRDLGNDRVDHESLATLCAELGILASMLSQQQAASQEIAELSHEDDGI